MAWNGWRAAKSRKILVWWVSEMDLESLKKVETFHISNLAHWSSGMIPPLGGGGPGFNSLMSPVFYFFKIVFQGLA